MGLESCSIRIDACAVPVCQDGGLGRNGMTSLSGKSNLTVKVPPTTSSVVKLQLEIELTPARSRTICQNWTPPTSFQSSIPTTACRAASRAALVAWMRVLNASPNWMKPNSRRTSSGRSSANSTAAAPSCFLPDTTRNRSTSRCRARRGIRVAGHATGHHPVPLLDRAEQGVEASDQQQRDDGDHERVLDRSHALLAIAQLAEASSHVRE